MGYQEVELKIPVSLPEKELSKFIRKKTNIEKFSFTILRKSLDARNKKNICWQYRIGLKSKEIKAGSEPEPQVLKPEFRKRNEHVVIAGTGPAGIFAAHFLLKSGFRVSLLERGSMVDTRKAEIREFEENGNFSSRNNYSFGEGGAGTFSDGKLTSRTKSISPERNYIFQEMINAGAPEEIRYMTHPHLGTDNLLRITKNIRRELQNLGCNLLFDQQVIDIQVRNGKVIGCETEKGILEADHFIFATGHSAYDTYRMLIKAGVDFRPKNFAIGFRAEHPQELINQAQWGVKTLPGVKAAEYRLTANTADKTPVYSFCMCPGGKVVPATPFAHTNIVNGMSYYQRDSQWANAAIVAGLNLNNLLQKEASASEALDWLENLEASYYNLHHDYSAPAATISSFLGQSKNTPLPESSYPFKLHQTDFHEILPASVIDPLKQGLQQFCRRLKAYESGIILGLESKTSSPIQVLRHPEKLYSTYENLYLAGEGSGWAGGIVSSAADGLKVGCRLLG